MGLALMKAKDEIMDGHHFQFGFQIILVKKKANS